MRKLSAIVLAGLSAVSLASFAAAAHRDTHSLNVALPDGSTAKVEYVGDIPPKVSVVPAPVADPFRAFGIFGRSMFDMDGQIDAMMRQVDAMARQPMFGAPGFNTAAYGNAPAGSTSVSIVSTSDGARTCVRRTDVISEGPGKAPKVASSVSGDCGGSHAAPKATPPTT